MTKIKGVSSILEGSLILLYSLKPFVHMAVCGCNPYMLGIPGEVPCWCHCYKSFYVIDIFLFVALVLTPFTYVSRKLKMGRPFIIMFAFILANLSLNIVSFDRPWSLDFPPLTWLGVIIRLLESCTYRLP